MLLGLTDDKSTLVQVMAWCRQAASHYLSQCWHRSLSPYGVTRRQWVNFFRLQQGWSIGELAFEKSSHFWLSLRGRVQFNPKLKELTLWETLWLANIFVGLQPGAYRQRLDWKAFCRVIIDGLMYDCGSSAYRSYSSPALSHLYHSCGFVIWRLGARSRGPSQ